MADWMLSGIPSPLEKGSVGVLFFDKTRDVTREAEQQSRINLIASEDFMVGKRVPNPQECIR